MLRGVETLILDEVHAVAGDEARRAPGALGRAARAARRTSRSSGSASPRRSGRSRRSAASSRAARPIELVDAGTRKELDLEVVVPVEDMREPGVDRVARHPSSPTAARWTPGTELDAVDLAVDLPGAPAPRRAAPLDDRLRQQPPARRAARAAPQRAGRGGDRARPPRLARARAAGRDRGAAEARRDPVPRRDLVARARHRHGRRRPRDPGRDAEVGRARPAADRPRRPRARRRLEGPHLPEVPRRPARVRGRREARCARARSRRRAIPRNPLDVLAQQIVAICAEEEIDVDELHDLVRGAYPFADLSRVAARERARHARRPLPVGRVRRAAAADRLGPHRRRRSAAATGARRLAVTNAGTIPDRGLFGVHLVDGGGRVGELDEEMVYEARAGQTFLLGASTWRIEEITRDRVLVSPAPGVPGAVPFWKGEGVGRPYELGEAIGAASRELVALCARRRRSTRLARATTTLDERAARNLLTFLREQAGRDRRGPVRPHGRGRALPRRDRRLARLHPHAVRRPRARAVGDGARRAAARRRSGSRRSRSGRTTASRSTCPTPTRRRRPTDLLIDPDEVEELVVARGRADRALRRALPRERRAARC